MNPTARKVFALLLITALFFLSFFINDPKKAPRHVTEKTLPLPASANLFVQNEWDTLKETLVGSEKMLTVRTCDNNTNRRFCKTNPMEKNAPEQYAATADELKAVLKIFEDYGVRTYDENPVFLSNTELFYRQDIKEINFLCGRAPIQVIHSTAVETVGPQKKRWAQKFVARRLIATLTENDSAARLFSMPEPSPLFSIKPTYLDTADILLDGKNIYVGYSGMTPPKGLLWLSQLFGNRFHVYFINIKDGKHLDEVMTLPNAKSVILKKDAFFSVLPPPLKKKRVHVVNSQENNVFLNDLILLSNTVAVINRNDTVLENILKDEGFTTVIRVSVDALHGSGASLRCLYAPLKRDADAKLISPSFPAPSSVETSSVSSDKKF